MKQPHDNWATYYDYVYEYTFVFFYKHITSKTLNVIQTILPQGTILDFGAGTGRLSLPLAEGGYQVIAVEKSSGMVGEFLRKSKQRNIDIEVHNCSIGEYADSAANLATTLYGIELCDHRGGARRKHT